MILVEPKDAAARVRAAMAYAGLEYADVEKKTGIGRSTLARIAARKGKPRGAAIEQLWAIADACDVPQAFMEFGFQAVILDEVPEIGRPALLRIAALEGQVSEIGSKLDQVLERLDGSTTEEEPAEAPPLPGLPGALPGPSEPDGSTTPGAGVEPPNEEEVAAQDDA